MEIRKNNIKQTIIKGYRKTRQLVDVITHYHSIPKKNYQEAFYESEKTLKIFEGELLYKDGCDLFTPITGITSDSFIYVNKKKVKILATHTEGDTLYLIVDIHEKDEDIEQEFESDTILEEYENQMNQRWEDFIAEYKVSSLMSLIRLYEKQGMKREEIIPLISEQARHTKQEKSSSSSAKTSMSIWEIKDENNMPDVIIVPIF